MSEEDALLAAVAADPVAALPRLVYADWLDDHSDPRAELVRLEAHLHDRPDDDAALVRFRKLSAEVDPFWLARVVRPEVARCGLRFDFACPKRWDELVPSNAPGLRHCQGCHRNVHLCLTRVDALRAAATGWCVAVDRRLVDPAAVARVGSPGSRVVIGRIAPPEPDSPLSDLVRRPGLIVRLRDRLRGWRP